MKDLISGLGLLLLAGMFALCALAFYATVLGILLGGVIVVAQRVMTWI